MGDTRDKVRCKKRDMNCNTANDKINWASILAVSVFQYYAPYTVHFTNEDLWLDGSFCNYTTGAAR